MVAECRVAFKQAHITKRQKMVLERAGHFPGGLGKHTTYEEPARCDPADAAPALREILRGFLRDD